LAHRFLQADPGKQHCNTAAGIAFTLPMRDRNGRVILKSDGASRQSTLFLPRPIHSKRTAD
jgi:hypothetical protein